MQPHTPTICALSTASSVSAIGVIRISGPSAIGIVEKCFSKTLHDKKPNSVHVGIFQHQNQLIDEVVVTLFKAPHSYTGEDVVEISCHGSLFILEEVVKALIQNGALPAAPGEFSMRAFLNGKLDLSQAEAVADLIASENKAAHNIAINQLRGGFSNELKLLREELIHFASLIELELDFAEEDVEFADRKQLNELFDKIYKAVSTLIQSFQYGNVIKSGIPVAIVGAPNAGKSTLLNALLNEEKAIVSPIAGTTRDTIEDTLILNGIKFRFTDTAGIRLHTNDEIEKIGIERTFEKIKQAAIVLYLVDSSEDVYKASGDKNLETGYQNALKIQQEFESGRVVLLATKTGNRKEQPELHCDFPFMTLSAKENIGVNELKQHLVQFVQSQNVSYNNVIVTNARHITALEKAKTSLESVRTGMQQQLSGDLIAMDIRATIHYLGEITGTISTEDLLGNIFSKFCIGK